MKLSTKIRLQYFLIAVLCMSAIAVWGIAGFGIAVFIMFIGQFIAFGTLSSDQCNDCGKYQLSGESDASHSLSGISSVTFGFLMDGKCEHCGSKL